MTRTWYRRFLAVWLAILLLLTGVALSVETGYARYTTRIAGAPAYVATLAAQPYLMQTDADGNVIPFAAQWQTGGGEQYISLLVRHTDQAQPARQNMTVRIRIFVPESIQQAGISPGNLVFTLQQGTQALYVSSADYLSTQTPLYVQQQQNGWIYSFYRTVQTDNTTVRQEVTYPLSGDTVDACMLRLTVRNITVDCTDFTVYVDRV